MTVTTTYGYSTFDAVLQHLERVEQRIDSRMNDVDLHIAVRMEGVETLITERLDTVDENTESIDGRLGDIEEKLDGLDGRMDDLDGRLNDIEGTVINIRELMHIESRNTQISNENRAA